jgi:NDP-sugar pyrophosphorylase family protein
MTDLIEKCINDDDLVSVYPVHEYWSDIGTEVDLNKARKDFKGVVLD